MIKTLFFDNGATVKVHSLDMDSVSEKLPVKVYSVGFNPFEGFYLVKKVDRLFSPEKLYGSTILKVDKALRAYAEVNRSFGVLLSGDKGTGKTMTASLLCNRMLDNDIPVVLVEDTFDPSGLSRFLEGLGEVVILIDEFGKKYNDKEGEQGPLLGLMDGTGSSKRMIIITENQASNINEFIRDRPGRMHYHFRYSKVAEDVVKGYCEDAGLSDSVIKDILLYRGQSYQFGFDVLAAIVSDFLREGGDVRDVIQDLNIERSVGTAPMVVITSFKVNGKDWYPNTTLIPEAKRYEIRAANHPDYWHNDADDGDDIPGTNEKYVYHYFSPTLRDIVDIERGEITYNMEMNHVGSVEIKMSPAAQI